jgi:WhiB family redox-sensing transcriptional regulator
VKSVLDVPSRASSADGETTHARQDWRHDAICAAEDPELFFPVGDNGRYEGPALVQIAEAKAVCRRCPVREQCLQWALATGQDEGVWGGLTEIERRQLRRHAARTAAVTA